MKDKVIDWTAIALGVLLALRQCVCVPVSVAVVAILLLSLTAAGLQRKVRINPALAVFVGVYGLSLLLNLQPATTIRVQRFAAFTIGMLALSPLVQTPRLTGIRRRLLESFILTLAAMVCVSSLLWIYAIAEGKPTQISNHFNYGFRGVFEWGMTLAPAAAVVFVWGLNGVLDLAAPGGGNQRDSIGRRERLYRILLIWSCVVSPVMLLGAGSRICIAGAGVACLVLLILRRDAVRNLVGTPRRRRVILTCLAMIILAGAVSPLATATLRRKIAYAAEHSMVSSREYLWKARIAEFETSPWLGIGYAREFPRQGDSILYGTSKEDLTEIEPGSSYLSLLSYGGVAGAATFLWFAVILCRRAGESIKRTADSPLRLSLLLFVAINALTEGWLMFAGALLFPLFWLLTASFFTMNKYWGMGSKNLHPNL